MAFPNFKVHLSPYLPAYSESYQPPTALEKQAGNILFRLFHPPPTPKKVSTPGTFLFEAEDLSLWGRGGIMPATRRTTLAMHPRMAGLVTKLRPGGIYEAAMYQNNCSTS